MGYHLIPVPVSLVLIALYFRARRAPAAAG